MYNLIIMTCTKFIPANVIALIVLLKNGLVIFYDFTFQREFMKWDEKTFQTSTKTENKFSTKNLKKNIIASLF